MRNGHADNIKAIMEKLGTQQDNGKNTMRTQRELANELRDAGHSDVADLVDPGAGDDR